MLANRAIPIATPSIQDLPALPRAFFCRQAEEAAPGPIGYLLVKRQAAGELLRGVNVGTHTYCQSEPALKTAQISKAPVVRAKIYPSPIAPTHWTTKPTSTGKREVPSAPPLDQWSPRMRQALMSSLDCPQIPKGSVRQKQAIT